MGKLDKCFEVVRQQLVTPQEWITPKGGISPEKDPLRSGEEITLHSEGIGAGRPQGMGGTVESPHEGEKRLSALSEFYASHEGDEKSPFEGGMLIEDPLFKGLIRSNPLPLLAGTKDPKHPSHLGVMIGRVGGRTK